MSPAASPVFSLFSIFPVDKKSFKNLELEICRKLLRNEKMKYSEQCQQWWTHFCGKVTQKRKNCVKIVSEMNLKFPSCTQHEICLWSDPKMQIQI